MVLLAFPYIDEMLFVRQLRLFEHDVDFLNVGTSQRIKVDHDNASNSALRFMKAVKLATLNRQDKPWLRRSAQRSDHLCEIAEAT